MDAFSTNICICEGVLGHDFRNQRLCLEALQTSGHAVSWQARLLRIDKDDRLAVLSDAIAKTYLCEMWVYYES